MAADQRAQELAAFQTQTAGNDTLIANNLRAKNVYKSNVTLGDGDNPPAQNGLTPIPASPGPGTYRTTHQQSPQQYTQLLVVRCLCTAIRAWRTFPLRCLCSQKVTKHTHERWQNVYLQSDKISLNEQVLHA